MHDHLVQHYWWSGMKQMIKEFEDKLRVDEGSKYIKIVSNGGAHSFIVKKADAKFKKFLQSLKGRRFWLDLETNNEKCL